MALFLGWLTPVTACVLLSVSVFNSGSSLSRSSSRHEPMAAMRLGSQNFAAYASATFQAGQNDLPAVTFECTNRNGSSSMNTLPRGRMN